ncbi:M48 family metallopeptidase [Cognatilysobacter segetis]|uniref:M48 family metallopeptidase n=1 Tax=Cognatilysobacter segetis TaxID=2492394 RepID=UPI00105D1C69|nr:SprT family zinc-dependent metalloprotease [Lysobacter segetis]
MEVLQLGALAVQVERKPIRHLHLSVYPPDGRVRVAAPRRLEMEAIRLFVIGHLPWIRREQRKMRSQRRLPAKTYVPRESHFLWGRRYLLNIVEGDGPPVVVRRHRSLDLHVRSGTSAEERGDLLERWYRSQVRQAARDAIGRWEDVLAVHVRRLHVQRMRTKWGSCTPRAGSIRLNTRLAAAPLECLNYVVLHEMAHLRFPNHGPGFVRLLNRVMPAWRDIRSHLNDLPLDA